MWGGEFREDVLFFERLVVSKLSLAVGHSNSFFAIASAAGGDERRGTYRCAEGHSLRVDDIVGGEFDGFGVEGVEEGFDEADF